MSIAQQPQTPDQEHQITPNPTSSLFAEATARIMKLETLETLELEQAHAMEEAKEAMDREAADAILAGVPGTNDKVRSANLANQMAQDPEYQRFEKLHKDAQALLEHTRILTAKHRRLLQLELAMLRRGGEEV